MLRSRESCAHTEGMETSMPLPANLVLHISSTWMLIFYNVLVNVSKLFSWVFWATLANDQTQWGSHGNLWFVDDRSEAQVSTWTCNWHLKWGPICGTESLICVIRWNLQVDSVRTELNCRAPSWCPIAILVVVGNPLPLSASPQWNLVLRNLLFSILVGQWCQTSLHGFICRLYVLFDEMSLHVFCSFSNWIFFLLLSFERFFMQSNSHLSDTWFANSFAHSAACLSFF